jgi:hypothetical protein
MKFGIATFITDLGIPPGPLATAVEERRFRSLIVAEHSHGATPDRKILAAYAQAGAEEVALLLPTLPEAATLRELGELADVAQSLERG